jgi:hypothetical protein
MISFSTDVSRVLFELLSSVRLYKNVIYSAALRIIYS